MYIIYIFRIIVLIFVVMFIPTFRPLYALLQEFQTWPFISLTGVDCSSSTSHVLKDTRRFDLVTFPKSVSSIPGEVNGELSERKLTGDNWKLTSIKHGLKSFFDAGVNVCVCVCVWERERERERESNKERVCKCVRVRGKWCNR